MKLCSINPVIVEWHKAKVIWWKDKLGLSWYAMCWIAFFKGILLTLIVDMMI
jgi:hypothetical protein|tara:strand:+ start:508 stop:663 length:156 start_codon:yes stop_codon:yes gene_type:complete